MGKLYRLGARTLGILLILGMGWIFYLQACFSQDRSVALGVGAVILILGLLLLYKKHPVKPDKRTCRIIVVVLSAVMLAGQIYIVKNFPHSPKGDYDALYFGAKEIASLGEFVENEAYFQTYEHQVFTAVCYGVLNRIFMILGSETALNQLATTVTNCLLTTMSGILLYFAAEHLWGGMAGLAAYGMFFFNISWWTHNIYIYPHTFSLIFLSAVIFCAAYAFNGNRLVWYGLLGLSLAMASLAEGILMIGFAAALITICVSGPGMRQILTRGTALIVSFVIAMMAAQGIVSAMNIMDDSHLKDHQLPLTHWIMMGLGQEGYMGPGTFSEEDYQSMIALPTAEQKKAYAQEQIKQRLAAFTPDSFRKQMELKSMRSWLGSCYGSSQKLAIELNRGWKIICVLFSFLLGITLIKSSSEDKKFPLAVFAGSWMIGLLLFLLLWESNTHYLHSSQLVMLLSMICCCALLFQSSVIKWHSRENE